MGGGALGLALTVALPVMTWLATFGLAVSTGGGSRDFIVALALAATVWPAYALARRRWGGVAV